jgi:hypothetical protein
VPTYVLRCLEQDMGERSAGADRRDYFERWLEWLGTLSRGGHFRLIVDASQFKTVTGRAGTVTEGLPTWQPTPQGGVFLVCASDVQDVVELAKGCPILEHDGVVEIWPIQG